MDKLTNFFLFAISAEITLYSELWFSLFPFMLIANLFHLYVSAVGF